jgi:hypothetical protein
MGAYTLQNFTDYLKFELGKRDDLEGTPNYLQLWVNAAYRDICTRDRFWGLRVPERFEFAELVVDDNSYATAAHVPYIVSPANCSYIKQVFDVTSDRILRHFSSWRQYVEKTGRASASSEAAPTKWIRETEGKIFLWPTPDAVYAMTVSYRKIPDELTNVGDKTAIPKDWDDIVLKLAVVQSMMRLKQYDMAKNEKENWLDMMASKIGLRSREDKANRDFFKPDMAYKRFEY